MEPSTKKSKSIMEDGGFDTSSSVFLRITDRSLSPEIFSKMLLGNSVTHCSPLVSSRRAFPCTICFTWKNLWTCPSMLPKSKNLTSDSILLLVLLLSISGVGKKSQKFQNCLRIRVMIFNFSGVNLEGCNHF